MEYFAKRLTSEELMRRAEPDPFDPFHESKAQYAERMEIERLKACCIDLPSCHAIRSELELKAERIRDGIQRLGNHASGVAAAKAAVENERKSAVIRLLEKCGWAKDDAPPKEPDVDHLTLQARLDAEERARVVCEDAIKTANEELNVVLQQLQAVDGEIERYIRPELIHLGTRFNSTYMRQLDELRKTYSRMAALEVYLGRSRPRDIRVPHFASLPNNVPAAKFVLSIDQDDLTFWRDTEATLKRDPSADTVVKHE